MTAPRVEQLTRDELVGMSPAQIEEARRAGKLAVLLGGTAPVDLDKAGQLTRDDVAGMPRAQVEEARRRGLLDDLLASANAHTERTTA